jgi:tetratricopeptide (TPR) repeat protein/tRNA A-37 threonylcarbamoyl transferase component Bud32
MRYVEDNLEFNDVLIACLESQERGASLDLEAWLGRYPQFATELERFFNQWQRFDKLAAPLRYVAQAAGTDMVPADTGVPESITPCGVSVPGSFGDYELLEEIALGGMGVVYKARQKSLDRVVALKCLRASPLATVTERRRFQMEAEAAAGLDHPHIVPIYEVGDHQGLPYFSMKYMPGGTLAEQLPRFRDQPRTAARLVATVSQAVHHAHQRGILHRDLKPANILLDGGGQPHVSDFGLARRIDGDSGLTQSGAIVGTPGYMAPEQASGQRGAVTTATDIYGLGAILYALLTGKPPFQGDSVLETLQHVREREPEAPSGVNRLLDRDLETICLKCLEKEPARRYPSAEAVAEDLERWLRGEPILARPINSTARILRWMRRNRLIASLSVALVSIVLLALIALSASTFLFWREKNQKEAALQRAEERTRWARRAVHDMYTQVAEEWLADAPHMTRLQSEFLRRTLEFYKELSTDESSDPEVRFETAHALRRIGQTLNGDEDAPCRRAIELLETLCEDFPQNVDYRLEYVRSSQLLARLYRVQDRFREAEDRYRHTAELADKLVQDFAGAPACQLQRAIVLRELGELLWITEQAADSRAAYRQAEEISRELAARFPKEPSYQETLASIYRYSSWLFQDLGDFQAAELAARQALELYQKLVAGSPRSPELRAMGIGGSANSLGSALITQGRFEEAERILRQAVRVREEAAKDFPELLQLRHGLAQTNANLGWLLCCQGRFCDAEQTYQRAMADQQAMVRHQDAGPDRRQELSLLALNLAWLRVAGPVDLRDPSRGHSLIEQALALKPGDPTYLTIQAVVYYRQGDWQKSVNLLREVGERRDPTLAPLQGWISDTASMRPIVRSNCYMGTVVRWFFLAMGLERLRDPGSARACYQKAIDAREGAEKEIGIRAKELEIIQAEAAALVCIKRRSQP